ncbi:hypothetical protein ACFFIX_20185 [Metabacillus herbersteinensis]|uniref:Uncharacterized protein n=1 Tax=Metabacillus herbersteinensis TaxID=283816 RepID=A0ABV6GJ34_9BACI
MSERKIEKNSLKLFKEDFLELEKIFRKKMQTDQLEVVIEVSDKHKSVKKTSIEEALNEKLEEQLESIQMNFNEYSFTATREINLKCAKSICLVTIQADEKSWNKEVNTVNADKWVDDVWKTIDTFLDERNSKRYSFFTKIPYTFWLIIVGLIITLLPLSFPNNKIVFCIMTAVSFSIGTILSSKTKWFIEKFSPVKFSLSPKKILLPNDYITQKSWEVNLTIKQGKIFRVIQNK